MGSISRVDMECERPQELRIEASDEGGDKRRNGLTVTTLLAYCVNIFESKNCLLLN